jgi:hypothetical protein
VLIPEAAAVPAVTACARAVEIPSPEAEEDPWAETFVPAAADPDPVAEPEPENVRLVAVAEGYSEGLGYVVLLG